MAVAVYLLAVTVRLAFLAEARHSPLYQWPTIDESEHHDLAVAIATGTLPTTPYVKAPGYFYLLGGIYKVFGHDSLRARFVQVFLFSLSPVLVFLIAHRLFGAIVGVLAGILASVFWTLVFFSAELLDISLACLLYLLLAWLLVGLDDRRPWKWLVCGIVLGLGAITRPNILAYAPVLAVVVAVRAWRRATPGPPRTVPPAWLKTAAARIVQFGLGTALAIAPVTLRNLLVSKERLLVGAWGSAVFYLANNPQTDGKNVVRPTVRSLQTDLLRDPSLRNEGSQACYLVVAHALGRRPTYEEVEQYYRRLSREYVLHYPRKFMGDVFKRFCFLFNAYEYPFNKNVYHFRKFSRLLAVLSWLHYGIVMPVGMLGLIVALVRRPWPAGFSYHLALIVTYALPCTFFQVVSRYRIPLVYLMMPLVAYGAVEFVTMLRPPIQWQRISLSAGALCGLLVFSNVNVFGYSPARHEYLPFYYAGACMATGRHDLVVEVSDEIEQALADPNRAPLIPPNAMSPMFDYFYRRGDFARACRYGRQVILRGDDAPPETLDAILSVLIREGRHDDAKRVLERICAQTSTSVNAYTAQALLRYGRAYNDREALLAAKEKYAVLAGLYPEEQKFKNGLDWVTKALHGPATTSTPTRKNP